MSIEKNYYVDEYKRVMDNLKVSEDRVSLLAENIEAKALMVKEEKKRQMIVSTAIVAAGVGVGLVVSKLRKGK